MCNSDLNVDCRARADIHTVGADGRGAAGDGAADRRGHDGYCVKRQRGTTGTIEILREHIEQPVAHAEGVWCLDSFRE